MLVSYSVAHLRESAKLTQGRLHHLACIGPAPAPIRLPRAVPAFAGRDPDRGARPVINDLDPRLRGEGGGG
jgi:hypothetical protein